MSVLPNKTEMELYKSIGQFYVIKSGGDYKKAREAIAVLGISDIITAYDVVIIKTARPGLLIGSKGENIEALSKHLGKRVSVIEVNSLSDWLMPYEESY
jgi:hypothetical protein